MNTHVLWTSVCSRTFLLLWVSHPIYLKSILKSTLQEYVTRLCAFYGGVCSHGLTVRVPLLAPEPSVITHRHLDVFQWLPRVPYLLFNVTSVKDHRRIFPHVSNDGTQLQFVFIFFDQVTSPSTFCLSSSTPYTLSICNLQAIAAKSKASRNFLITRLTEYQGPWHGEILIVKARPDGEVVDWTDADFDVVPPMLCRYVSFFRSSNVNLCDSLLRLQFSWRAYVPNVASPLNKSLISHS